jgi:2-hydroxychromene-2-carboxylate isomerase
MKKNAPIIEFFFDCSSPWTYLAFRTIQPLAAQLNASISWRPVLVGGIFNSVNKGMYTAREDMSSPKNRYALKDLQDCAREAGVKIVFPPKVFPVNSVKAMRGCLWIARDAQTRGVESRCLDFMEAIFAAYFTRQEDISQDDVLAAICAQSGIDAVAFMTGIAAPDIKEALKANTQEAIARGAFGSPTFFVGDDMYFGNDRLPLVAAAVRRVASV